MSNGILMNLAIHSAYVSFILQYTGYDAEDSHQASSRAHLYYELPQMGNGPRMEKMDSGLSYSYFLSPSSGTFVFYDYILFHFEFLFGLYLNYEMLEISF